MLGIRLKEARTSKGISLNEMANNMGLSKSYLSLIENGHKVPTKNDTITLLSREYKIPLSKLSKMVHSTLYLNGVEEFPEDGVDRLIKVLMEGEIEDEDATEILNLKGL
jgi:transcriptional regulator with XRE-family HTH domain